MDTHEISDLAWEKVQPDYVTAAPDVNESTPTKTARVLSLEALVRMKLTSFRDKDRTHLRDLVGVGQVNADWVQCMPPELGRRLQELLDHPED